jgi:leader peptidase (prepilin peptidase)/N-methyltransferase
MTTLTLETVLSVWSFVLGAAIGSFLNVVIYRLPNGFRLTLPSRSVCMKCKTRLSVFDNIPILGYLLLRGRCRYCNTIYSARYPLVEVLTASLFYAVYKYFGIAAATPYYWWFVAALVAITFIDLDHRIVPDLISLPGIVLGLTFSFTAPDLGIYRSGIGAAVGGGIFWLMGWTYERLTGREGLGFGDVKMIAMIGAFLGPQGVMGTIVISSMIGSIVGVVIMVVQKKDLKLAVPYGPFLAIGALAYLFWGDYFALRFYPHTYE